MFVKEFICVPAVGFDKSVEACICYINVRGVQASQLLHLRTTSGVIGYQD
jgi:hypothetical protein